MAEEGDLTTNKYTENLSISRGMVAEKGVNFDDLVDLVVYDEKNKEIKFEDIYKTQKTIIIFVRHFLCFMAKEYCEDLAKVPEEYLQKANVNLVVIGCAPAKFIKEFVGLTGLKCTVYCDPERKVYKALEFADTQKPGLKKTSDSHHVKSWYITGLLKSTWRAMWTQEWQGDVFQQGGSLVVGPGNILHFCHPDANDVDHMSINELLRIAGVEQVNFKLDQPVLHV